MMHGGGREGRAGEAQRCSAIPFYLPSSLDLLICLFPPFLLRFCVPFFFFFRCDSLKVKRCASLDREGVAA